MAVGAASYLDTPGYGQTPAALAYYSSWGTQRVLYDAAGNRLDIPKVLRAAQGQHQYAAVLCSLVERLLGCISCSVCIDLHRSDLAAYHMGCVECR